MSGEHSAPAAGGRPPEKRGLIRRLVRLVVFAAVGVAIALVAGFKIERGQWAWQDPAGFSAYSQAWYGWAKARTCTAAGEVKNFASGVDQRLGLSDKLAAGVDKVKSLVRGETEPATAAAAGSDPEAERAANFGFTRKEIEQLPPGYYEAYKRGQIAYGKAMVAWRSTMPGTEQSQQNLREAKVHFDEARQAFEQALAAYPEDPRAKEMLYQVQEYLHDISKRLTLER